MHVIIEHLGDGRTEPEQCLQWRVDNREWLEPFGTEPTEFSHVEGVEKVWTDKMEQLRVEFPDGETGTDAPAIPNARIVTVEGD